MIDNALKYGPADSSIDVAVARNGNDAVLTITDQGPGITPEHRSRIFDRFYRVDEGRSREMGALVRGIRGSKTQAKSACGRNRYSDCLRRLVDRAAMTIGRTCDFAERHFRDC